MVQCKYSFLFGAREGQIRHDLLFSPGKLELRNKGEEGKRQPQQQLYKSSEAHIEALAFVLRLCSVHLIDLTTNKMSLCN